MTTVELTLKERKLRLNKEVFQLKPQFLSGLEKLLNLAAENEKASKIRKLNDSAGEYLINEIADIISLLTLLPFSSIKEFINEFRHCELGIYTPLKPDQSDIEKLEIDIKKRRKRIVLYGPYDQMQNVIKDIVSLMKSNVALFIYGVAEKMIFQLLKDTVYYDEASKSEDEYISTITIQMVLKLYSTQNKSSSTDISKSIMPDTYDKCIDQLRSFLQLGYDQCNIIHRLFLDPVKHVERDYIKRTVQLVKTFMNIYRSQLESIEDMNDHVSSGGSASIAANAVAAASCNSMGAAGNSELSSSGLNAASSSTSRTCEQGLIGYCLEFPTEDYLLEYFIMYSEMITQPDYMGVMQSILDHEECRRHLMSRANTLLQTLITKYSFVHGVANWPNLHHKGCINCSLVNNNNGNSNPMTDNSTNISSHTPGDSADFSGSSNVSQPSSPIGEETHSHIFTQTSVINRNNTLSSIQQQQHQHISNSGPASPSSSKQCNYLINCYKYLLPRLLYLPIFHFLYLDEIIQHFKNLASDPDDIQTLKDVISMYRCERIKLMKHIRVLDQLKFKLCYDRIWHLHLKEFCPIIIDMNIDRHTQKLKQLDLTSRNNDLIEYGNSELITKSQMLVRHETTGKLVSRVVYLFNDVLLIFKQDNSWRVPPLTHYTGNLTSASSIGSIASNIGLVNNSNNSTISSLSSITGNSITSNQLASSTSSMTTSGDGSTNTGGNIIASGSLKLKKIIPLNMGIHVIDYGCNSNQNPGSLGIIPALYYSPGSIIEITESSPGNSTTLTSCNGISLNPAANTDLNGSPTDLKWKTGQNYAFSIQYQELKVSNGSTTIQTVYFVTDKSEVKADWMASLLQIQTNKLFEKYIKEIPRQEIPLRFPDPKKYIFAEPDSNDNIRFEKKTNDGFIEINMEDEDNVEDVDFDDFSYHYTRQIDTGGHPQIRYATLYKLIERLTYHTYHDTHALHMFLLAYRRFTTPTQLLDLLIARFNVPAPDFTPQERQHCEWDNIGQSLADQMLKRFKNSYQRRIQRRVIWVLLHWTQSPSFFRSDFADSTEMKSKLLKFIQSIKSKELQKPCAILKRMCLDDAMSLVQPQLHQPQQQPLVSHTSVQSNRNTNGDDTPINVHSFLIGDWTDITLFNVHPVELARQITLHEWDMYQNIQYWEVEGKESSSTPYLSRSKQFSNRLRNWFVWSIVSQEHHDDRALAIMRVADIMMLCAHWNNFQANQEARAALISAAVFRLRKTYNYIMRKYRCYKNVLNLLRKQAEGIKSKKTNLYIEEYEDNIRRVEECKPPESCVPFIAMGVTTKLIHAEYASPDFVSADNGSRLINFRKHLRLSQIIERYLSFQRLNYTFRRDETILTFLENLDPLAKAKAKNEDDFENIVFKLSESYEPRTDSDSNSSNFDNSTNKLRQVSRTELKLADQLNSLSLKDKLDINKQVQLISNLKPPSISQAHSTISIMSSSNCYISEPNTPKSSRYASHSSTLNSTVVAPPLPPKSRTFTAVHSPHSTHFSFVNCSTPNGISSTNSNNAFMSNASPTFVNSILPQTAPPPPIPPRANTRSAGSLSDSQAPPLPNKLQRD